MRFLVSILATALVCSGCTTTFRATSPEDLSRKLGTGDGTVLCRDSTLYEATEIIVAEDSIRFDVLGTNDRETIALANVLCITRVDRFRGAVGGAFLGTMLGMGLGFCVGGIAYAATPPGSERGLALGAPVFFGVIGGCGVGLIVGSVKGHEDRYIPAWSTSSTSPGRPRAPAPREPPRH